MRILWLGNPPWVGSGYGEQAALFIPRLANLGHDIGVVANFGLNGVRQEWNGLTVYPADNAWGNRTIKTYADHFKADLIIALCDAWVMKPQDWHPDVRMSIWAPIDHYPVPPSVFATLNDEKVRPIAMSRFGETEMRKLGLDPCYVPHGVDTNLFKPQPEIRDEIRDRLGVPRDCFLVGMVAANKGNPSVPRKSFPQAFAAFSAFAQQHDDAYMYVHAESRASGGGGIDLNKLSIAVGIPPAKIGFPTIESLDLGYPREVVAALYQSFDVLLAPSMGEGFGIPILEAQASGVPVITSNHSAMVELTQAGWIVDGDPWWDSLQDSFAFVPSIASIYTALGAAYEAREELDPRVAGVAWAQGYDADLVTRDFWVPTLEKLTSPREVPPLRPRNGTLTREQREGLATSGVLTAVAP